MFFCPLCGVAWRQPPPQYELNEVSSLEELAPAGIELPSKYDVDTAGFTQVRELPAEDWLPDLEPFLRRSVGDT